MSMVPKYPNIYLIYFLHRNIFAVELVIVNILQDWNSQVGLLGQNRPIFLQKLELPLPC